MISLYEIGIGLVITAVLLIFFALIIYFTDTFVHSWIIWVIVGLFFLILLGLFLLLLFYYYYETYNIGLTVTTNEKTTVTYI